jgi:hypothetical protein
MSVRRVNPISVIYHGKRLRLEIPLPSIVVYVEVARILQAIAARAAVEKTYKAAPRKPISRKAKRGKG